MALYNTINAAVRDTPALLPADCPLRDDVLANFDDDAPIAQWARGFVRGQHWLEQLWEDLPEELDEELAAVLMTLSFFSSRRLAEGFLTLRTSTGSKGRHCSTPTPRVATCPIHPMCGSICSPVCRIARAGVRVDRVCVNTRETRSSPTPVSARCSSPSTIGRRLVPNHPPARSRGAPMALSSLRFRKTASASRPFRTSPTPA